MPQSSGFNQSKKIKLNGYSRILLVAGFAYILATFNGSFFSSLPLALLQSGWQLRFYGTLLSAAPSFLIGALLVCGAAELAKIDPFQKKCSDIVKKSCVVFSFILIATIPLQLYSGVQLLSSSASGEAELLKQRKLVYYRISNTSSELELRSYLGSLPDQPQIPAQFDAPFPVIKSRVVANLKSAYNKLEDQVKRAQSTRLQSFIFDFARNTVQSLIMAVAFYCFNPNMPSFHYIKNTYLGFARKSRRR